MGSKRKRGAYYAVHRGREQGIYSTWKECEAQVSGFSGARFKSFDTEQEAAQFVKEGPCLTTVIPEAGLFYYALKQGPIRGIFNTWKDAQTQIRANFAVHPGAQLRQYATRVEAERFLSPEPEDQDKRQHKRTKPLNSHSEEKSLIKLATMSGEQEQQFEPGTKPIGPDAIDGFDTGIKLDSEKGELVYKSEAELKRTMYVENHTTTAPIRVWTDGSSLGNGKMEAYAGVGVYFGPEDKRNISEPLSGTRQTNQRAELTAIQRALDIVPKDRSAIIVTDSMYAKNCVTTWAPKWARTEDKDGKWRTGTGKTVENRDIIEQILNQLAEKQSYGVTATIEWVKGHAKDAGNVQADKLAVNGAQQCKRSGE